jgi:FkbM family methyltransferase
MILNKLLNFIGYRCINIALELDNCHHYPTEEYKRYKLEDPHEMKRVTYPLNKDSLVVDVGGLTGDWASRIYCLYSCNVDVYEPHPDLSLKANLNFATNQKVHIYGFGLSNKDDMMQLYGDYWNASLYKNDCGNVTEVPIRQASNVFNKYKHIDLLKLNVEGAEYDILPDLIANFDMTKINDIQIQFHRNVPGYDEKRDVIRKGLSETHTMNWCYDYIFENWTVNK